MDNELTEYEKQKELKALSKKVFGRANQYKSLYSYNADYSLELESDTKIKKTLHRTTDQVLTVLKELEAMLNSAKNPKSPQTTLPEEIRISSGSAIV